MFSKISKGRLGILLASVVVDPRVILSKIRSRVELYVAVRNRRRGSRTTFVAITGSSAKTTTCLLLSHILGGAGPTHTMARANSMPYLRQSLRQFSNDSAYAVFELGVGFVGRMMPMVRLLRPQVGIVTLIGAEHYKSFRSLDAVAAEKGQLVERLPSDGMAILNADDEHVMAMTARARCRVVTFGTQAADYSVEAVSAALPNRLTVNVRAPGWDAAVTTRFVGEQHWVAVIAAVACAAELGVDRSIIVDRIASFEPLVDRCSIVSIPGGPDFLMDTFKAPWFSLKVPFEVVRQASAPRKRIVIGEISNYLGSSRKANKKVKRWGLEVADQIVFVGCTPAHVGASDEDLAQERVVCVDDVEALDHHLKDTSMPGELILLKSCRVLHLERAMLARQHQVRCWEPKCDRRITCFQCGRFEVPFKEQHPPNYG
jgi:UDP-N-acetylmuramoyl-tripeptide--D-alanyl-D-alanine ligase